MKLALITGAGASTRLGKERPLPMMPQLSRTLFEALESACDGLPEAVGLAPEMTGPEFESALGRLFQWRDSRHLNQEFSGLSFNPPPGPQARTSEMQSRWHHEDTHLETLMRTIDETLFAEFGSPRIDAEATRSAFGRLFDLIGDVAPRELFCATTNYDPSLEIALRRLGMQPEMGFAGEPWETLCLDAGRIDVDRGPVLVHLHGAVGWYREDDGSVTRHGSDRRPNQTLGRPALLYPDPAKDPAESVTRDLWGVFGAFVFAHATHALVVGHSLHDPPLFGRLKTAASMKPRIRVGVVVHSVRRGRGRHVDVLDTELHELVQAQIPGAFVIRGSFGPEPDLVLADLRRWVDGDG